MAPWIWTALEWFAELAIIAAIVVCTLFGLIWFNDWENSAGVSDE